MLNTPRQSSLVLTRGGVFDNIWPAIRDDFPSGSTTSIEFYDSNGNTIATVAGAVETKRLVYLESDTDLLDSVPNGAQYELFVTTADGPYKLEYGTIIRREATFFTPPPTSLEGESRLFIDSLNRDAVGRRWVVTRGGIAMHQVASTPEPRYAMGPNFGLLFSQAGMRYFRPFGGDSWRVRFGVYSTGSGLGLGGDGKMRVHVGCDIRLNTGMAFEIETASTSKIHTGIVTSPTDMDYSQTVNHTTADEDEFIVDYSNISKIMNVYKNDDFTAPIITFDDTTDLLPHGPGYRYWGFSWDSSLAATGPLLWTLEAQDYV
jgi:hypothetical protein